MRVEAKVVVRWLLLIAWRYKLSQADKRLKEFSRLLYLEIYDVTKFLVSMSLNVCGVKAGVIPR